MKKFNGGFEDLEAWKEAHNFRMVISQILKKFPSEEKYKLVGQIKRASRSISANDAEGYGRYYYKENIQFCRQARGSLMETLDHLICARDENFLNDTELNSLREKYSHVLKLLNGHILYLKTRQEKIPIKRKFFLNLIITLRVKIPPLNYLNYPFPNPFPHVL